MPKKQKPEPSANDFTELREIAAKCSEESGIEVKPHQFYITFTYGDSNTGLIPAKYRKAYTDDEFFIEVNFVEWTEAYTELRYAIVDERLRECGYDENGKAIKHPPDLRGYAANLAKYGAWHQGATIVAKALSKHEQLNLMPKESNVVAIKKAS